MSRSTTTLTCDTKTRTWEVVWPVGWANLDISGMTREAVVLEVAPAWDPPLCLPWVARGARRRPVCLPGPLCILCLRRPSSVPTFWTFWSKRWNPYPCLVHMGPRMWSIRAIIFIWVSLWHTVHKLRMSIGSENNFRCDKLTGSDLRLIRSEIRQFNWIGLFTDPIWWGWSEKNVVFVWMCHCMIYIEMCL